MKFASNQAMVALLMGLGAFVTQLPAHATLTPAQKCAAAKMKATAKWVDSDVKCYAKTNLAAAVDLTCLTKAYAKFTTAFTNAEKPGACMVNADVATVASGPS